MKAMTGTVTMLESPTHREDALLERMLAGDREAFSAIYRREQGRVFRFALQMSGSVVIAEDITQEAFLTLLRDGSRYDAARGTLSSYLFGVTRNLVLRVFEKDRGDLSLDDNEEGRAGIEPVSPDDTLASLDAAQRTEAVRQAVLALPPLYRETVVLCDLEEQSYQETAEILGVSVGTVRSRLHRGRDLLYRKLSAMRKGVSA